jgi:hypothetical protein
MENEITHLHVPRGLLHPNMAHHYRVQVEECNGALQEDSDIKRMTAAAEGRCASDRCTGRLGCNPYYNPSIAKSPPERRANRVLRWLRGQDLNL